MDWIDYQSFGVQFIAESQLTEEMLDPLTTRLYVIPDDVVRQREL